MDRLAPAVFIWNGEHMVPVPAASQLCNRQFISGMRYRLAEYEPRSRAEHKFSFAWLEEAFRQLPERYAMQFASAEHLRKWALCRTEYRNLRRIACASNKEARRVAAFIRRGNRIRGETFYSEIAVKGKVVIEITPKSQAMKEMDKQQFHHSMEQVREIIAELIGVTPEQLMTATRHSS